MYLKLFRGPEIFIAKKVKKQINVSIICFVVEI